MSRATPALQAVLDSIGATRPWTVELFGRQLIALRSKGKRKAIRCGRRAGKTVLAAAAISDALEVAQFDEAIVYAARTRAIAKRLIWAKLHRCARIAGKKWVFSEADLTIHNDKGGFVIVVGLDKPAEIEKLRGIKLRRFVGDEPATYTSILDALYDEILEPACADLGGEVWLVGTPGPILSGFWHAASTRAPGFDAWDQHHWTMFDNPHMPNASAYLAEVLERKGLTVDDPTIRQEYYGEWCADDRAQVYRYVPAVNDHTGMPPDYRADKWVHTVCVDFGVVDDFAWTVMASHPHDTTAYVVEQGAGVGWLIDQMADTVLRLVTRYSVHFLGGDPGGGGKALIEQWNQRYSSRAGGILMQVVEKTEKRANIDIYNSDLRTGRVRLCQPACQDYAREITLLPWKDSSRMHEHPAYPNNRADSALYAHRHHRAYLHSAPRVEPNMGALSPDDQARIAYEERQLWRDNGADWWDR